MARNSLVIDAWIREAEEASQWVEDLENKVKNENLLEKDTARFKLLEIGVKVDRLESLLRNPPSKPVLTHEDLDFRWKMLSDIQLRTRALARSLYPLPSLNRPGIIPSADTYESNKSTNCYDKDTMETSSSEDNSELGRPLVDKVMDDQNPSELLIKQSSSFLSPNSLWKAASTICLVLGVAAVLFVAILLYGAV